MKIRSAEFEISSVRPSQWPLDGLPEVAFVGRSNVGKSSLLNKLLGRKSLARISSQPGKTQQINFYRVNQEIRFGDLPGYGYAQVSKQQRSQFLRMMDTYLSKRDVLRLVFHLIDSRHDPTKDDIARHKWLLDTGVPIVVVATKIDKLPKTKVKASLQRIRTVLASPYPVLGVSAAKSIGIDEMWEYIQSATQDDNTGTEAENLPKN
ncbi:ribosome biogenesis GTP-binding protein YihA/YsxC [Alicyclobacillus sp. SO9]|uniref:ribosome biogenesis GTP-binding protein YihA/YsxC n=1 Tax=Alicyclobacillus sp. SO9 TaxID=2665646 RepID=UPI0018E8D28D|nr:ribosome biogenesis GTP-binding protein YihA/YsxC [Alicyclobacillus sp. SO9]QQE77027.1 YihA family ribosome biogenesis GTP-binding protein [Alicyclobacillus sp. SO9]